MPKKRPLGVQIHASQIEMVALADLKPYERNARTHDETQIAALAKVIADSGFTAPLVLEPDGTIIAGHGRLEAARLAGMAAVPCVRVANLSAAQIKALRLSDNQLATRSAWDIDLLKSELQGLDALGFDLDLTGFEAGELVGIFAEKVGKTDPDDAPEPQAEAVSALGDIWLMGNHRLACGDCTDPETVLNALADAKPHLMVTDPPYGVEYDANWRNEADRANGKAYGASAVGIVENDGRADWSEAWALFGGDIAYAWHADRHASEVQRSLEASGFVMRSQIIWAKTRLIISRGDYHWQHEPCWYAVRKGSTGRWSGDRSQTTLWTIEHMKSDTGHSTQKPVECMKRPIENNSQPGNAIYEPFSGSGTTIIAAEMTGRRCIAIELSPIYIDVAVRRWQAFVNGSATLEATGQTFAEVERERLGEFAEEAVA